MRVLLVICCALAIAVVAPVGAGATAASGEAVASKAGTAPPSAKAPWKFSDPSLPLTASYDGKKLKVIATAKGACEESELNFVDVSYKVNASIPVSNGSFDSDVTVTGSNGKKQVLLLRGKVNKDILSISITASFKDAATCIIGGDKNSVKRKL